MQQQLLPRDKEIPTNVRIKQIPVEVAGASAELDLDGDGARSAESSSLHDVPSLGMDERFDGDAERPEVLVPDNKPIQLLGREAGAADNGVRRFDDRLGQELTTAQQRRDALAAKLMDIAERQIADLRSDPDYTGSVETGVEVEAGVQGVDFDTLMAHADRHVAATLVSQYQDAKARRYTTASARIAAEIIAASNAETERRPTAAAVRAAGLEWVALRADAERHLVAQAPEEIQTDLEAAREYLAARAEAYRIQGAAAKEAGKEMAEGRTLPGVPEAHRRADAAAMVLAARPGAEAALHWWAEIRAVDDKGSKPVNMAELRRGADRDLAAKWIEASDNERGALAARITERMAVDKKADKFDMHMALRQIGGDDAPTRVRADAERHLVAQAPEEMQSDLEAAREYLAARAEAYRIQGAAAKEVGKEMAEGRTLPGVPEAHRRVDAAAFVLAERPGAEAALQWWAVIHADDDKKSKPISMVEVRRAADRNLAAEWMEAPDHERGALAARMALRQIGGDNAPARVRADADHHLVAQAPEKLRFAMPSAVAYLDAWSAANHIQREAVKASGAGSRAVRALPEVRAARQQSNAAAAELAAYRDGEQALQWLQQARGNKFTVTAESMRRDAAYHVAGETVAAWQEAKGADRHAVGKALLQQMQIERQSGGPQPTAQACHEAGVDIPDMRQQVAQAEAVRTRQMTL